jgi:dTDP-4-dehydrorhamnose 3,5-epimerase-like enzyme
MSIHPNLSSLFQDFHFKNYPIVQVPQEFKDSRGTIRNIADGTLGDVAFITSSKGAVRANHIHTLDWHLTYLVSGRMIYQWKDAPESSEENKIEIGAGQLFFTPTNTPHKMTFLEESQFIAVSGLHRDKDSYESDTRRLPEDFFPNVEL